MSQICVFVALKRKCDQLQDRQAIISLRCGYTFWRDASLTDNGAQSAVDKSIQDIEDHQCLIILGPFVNDEKTSINNLNPIPDRQCYELSLQSAVIVREFNSQVAIQVQLGLEWINRMWRMYKMKLTYAQLANSGSQQPPAKVYLHDDYCLRCIQ